MKLLLNYRGGGHPQSKFLQGFTMAEVLITLGIIGIVAAMTLPTVINNAKNKELQTQLKKTYSELNQISQLFYNDYGMSVPEYLYSPDKTIGAVWYDFVQEIFPKYLKVTNKVDSWSGGSVDPDTGSNLDALPYDLYSLNGKNRVRPLCDNSGFYSDIIGRWYSFNDPPTSADVNGPIICVDINGPRKPNRLGKDFFLFVFTVDNYVIPMGQVHKNSKEDGYNYYYTGKNYCNKNGTSMASNAACAYYAVADVSPDGHGTYWKDFLNGR